MSNGTPVEVADEQYAEGLVIGVLGGFLLGAALVAVIWMAREVSR